MNYVYLPIATSITTSLIMLRKPITNPNKRITDFNENMEHPLSGTANSQRASLYVKQENNNKCPLDCCPEKAMAPHSSTLAWEIPWMEEPGGLQSMGVAESRTRLSDFTFTFHSYALEKEMATHSSVLALRIPGTGEPGGLPSMGSHRVGHN